MNAEPPKANPQAADGAPPPKRIRVLHVDDEESFTRLLKISLGRTGKYEYRYENDPHQAAQAAREFKPDVILLDVIMPKMFGGDVADQFKADPELKSIPIIFFSAALRKQQVKECGGIVRGYPWLAQPASLEEVMAAIDKYATIPEGMRRCSKCSTLLAVNVPDDQCPKCSA
jgi:CheY-like chemotaxis protein